MKGIAKKITVWQHSRRCEWLYGQEPETTAVDLDSETVQAVDGANLAAIASRVLTAAQQVLRTSPIEQSQFSYSSQGLTGGCWRTSPDGMPMLTEFKAATLERIANLI